MNAYVVRYTGSQRTKPGIVGQIDEGMLIRASTLRAHESSAELTEIHLRINVARKNAHAQTWNIHALGDHVYRDDPRGVRSCERADAFGCGALVGDDDCRLDADARSHQIGDESGMLLVHRNR